MSEAAHRRPVALFAGAGVTAAGVIVAAVLDPGAAAAGWLIAFTFWSQILIGSLVLAMIYRLTGGRWGDTIMPAPEPAARALPLLFIVILPIFVALPMLYPWSLHSAAIKPDVLAHYLNTPFFIARSIVTLAGCSALAWLLPRSTSGRCQLTTAVGLVFYCVVISSVAVDWYLSLEAPFTSSSFGASVAVTQLMAGMAWAVLVAPDTGDDEVTGDMGGLLLAFVLGITYIDFMAVLVIWYGDLPREEAWFVERAGLVWRVLAVVAFLLASLGPVALLIVARIRHSRFALRLIATSVLIGLACYDGYLIAPRFGIAALAAALLAIVAVGLGLAAFIAGLGRGVVFGRRPFDVR
jgi:hypothetical protein